jgi:1,4-dihydroxy-2-naphthoate octaprenyltransferase
MSAPGECITHWIEATRPKTLLLAASPVVAGVALAAAQTGRLAPFTALLTLLASVAIQAGTNLHNDAADFERGTDTPARLGPPRATAQGWFTPDQVKTAAYMVFGLAFAIGVLLALRGGWPIVALGLASLAAGWAYTGGPRPIAYGPFGEVFVLAFFGVAAVWGSHYLQTLTHGPGAGLVGLALGLPAAAVLLLNNYRDLETDRVAGRRTLVQLIGQDRTRWLYAALLIGPLPILLASGLPGRPWLVLAALPLALALIQRLFHGPGGPGLNPLLGTTGGYQALLVALLALGLAVPGGA